MNNLGDFYSSIPEVLYKIRQKAFAAINFAAMKACYQIGQRSIEQEQQFKKIYTVRSQLVRSGPFLSAFYSYTEKEPAA